MNDQREKLFKFVSDFDSFVYENTLGKDDPTDEDKFECGMFDEAPLVLLSTPFCNGIEFMREQIFHESEIQTWKEMLEEVERIKKCWEVFHKYIKLFFEGQTNKELEEKYALGTEEETPLQP